MYKRMNVMQQIKTHIVALISLVTALSGLLYNNWRDHQNELNHNMRNAAFEVLKDLGELQTIVNYAHFEADSTRGNPIEGWKYAIQVRDLSRLLSPASQQKGKQLYLVWEKDWDTLNEDSVSEQRISQQIAETRSAVLTAIDTLQ
ncbi:MULTISPECIES: hypothetical protein [unclassified Methylotenera]|uniref:hypothetical protein n=1 Tax=unclassified Methylotenera TaxID=2643294 RepID=UPI000367F095|nr:MULTISPECIES: hypothetical protein [unclassified Methylotenera]